jgi:phosphomevalonate kinase
MRALLLALSGKRFSGKDTFAAALVNEARSRGLALATYAFADESKRLFVDAEAQRGIEVDLARLRSDRAYKEQWRPQLTAFTVAALAADPLVFCRAVTQRVEAAGAPALITDLRLRLELEHLRPRFALRVVRIVRGDAQRSASGWRFDPAKDEHRTETELDDPALWDEIVTNDGTIADLDAAAARVLSACFG